MQATGLNIGVVLCELVFSLLGVAGLDMSELFWDPLGRFTDQTYDAKGGVGMRQLVAGYQYCAIIANFYLARRYPRRLGLENGHLMQRQIRKILPKSHVLSHLSQGKRPSDGETKSRERMVSK
jgi:hypothetical protein